MKPTTFQKPHLISLAYALLILLWSYTGLSKLIDHAAFEKQVTTLLTEKYPESISIGIPVLEILTAFSLVWNSTRMLGLYLSVLLMTAFTAYVALVIAGHFGPAPCTCGGIISALSWKAHLILNITILSLVLYLLFHQKQKGGSRDTMSN
ncbi:hypothetical protein OQZ33_22885 [Pedobacter sp. MC2016-05]|uniref:MauE/DoxX family redox-associated membrane protein n=1 Tax=Pedobacter sp. MC2016-05 TaxID=2994474 RepID=UPI0022460B92|nr:MauE/DoxX family redox-associated membrane protein [Pedobacter sp. MC2016-05]MCX2477198.1 hypothetical protein [Pedobacter sp. MC2016-05]